MKSFWKLTGLAVQSLMYYRISFLLNLMTPFIQMFGQYLLWGALYGLQNGSDIGSMSRKEMYTYILVAFALNNLLSWSAENKLSKEIRSGTVIARCLRPVPFICQSVSEMLGNVITQGTVNLLACLVGFTVFGRYLQMPQLQAVFLFIPCLLLSVSIRILVIHIFSLLCFFCTGYLGISWTRTALTDFFSGALIPIVMFPEWLQKIAYLTPFPYMVQVPISVLLGQEMPISLVKMFIIMIVWIGLFLALHCVIFRQVRRNMSIAGG